MKNMMVTNWNQWNERQMFFSVWKVNRFKLKNDCVKALYKD